MSPLAWLSGSRTAGAVQITVNYPSILFLFKLSTELRRECFWFCLHVARSRGVSFLSGAEAPL